MYVHLYNQDWLFTFALIVLTALALLGAWKLVEVIIFDAPWVCTGFPNTPQAGSTAESVLPSMGESGGKMW
jgi:hypothetical protein